MKTLLLLITRLVTSLFALAFLLNGVYEYYELHNSSNAAVSLAVCSLLLNWYMDVTKKDKTPKEIEELFQ